jgi:hypothetical protein
VRVTDVLSSKIQFTLFFTQGDWYISNGYKSRIPSNPCWVLLTNEAPIWQKTRIKYNETIFEVIFYLVGPRLTVYTKGEPTEILNSLHR